MFSFTSFGLGAAAALLLGLIAADLYLKRSGIPMQSVLPLNLIVIPMVFVFSRLLFLAANCTYYLVTLSSLLPALYFWEGGYSVSGAMLGAYLAGGLYVRFSRVPRVQVFNAITLGIPVALCVERLMESGTGLGEGREYDWFGFIPASTPQPVWLAEAIAALGILVFILFLLARRPAGFALTPVFLIVFGLVQSYLESLRNDGHMVVHFVRIQQVLYFATAVIIVLSGLRRLYQSGNHRRALICSVLTILLAGLCVASEFGVDRWGSRALAYSVMLLSLAGIAYIAHTTFRRLST